MEHSADPDFVGEQLVCVASAALINLSPTDVKNLFNEGFRNHRLGTETKTVLLIDGILIRAGCFTCIWMTVGWDWNAQRSGEIN